MKKYLNLSQKTTQILLTSDLMLDNKMSETAVSATPSPTLKRRQSVDKNIENENYAPKKKRESAIRSENNLKMLIQNGQVDTYKQKVSPKKVLSLGKEAQTETLANLISTEKFDKLDKLYIRTVAAASHGSKEDIETSDSEPETSPLPQPKNRLEFEPPNDSKSTNTRNALNPNVPNLNNTFNVPNSTNATKAPNPTSTIKLLNPNKTLKVLISTSAIKVPNLTNISNVSNPTSTTEVPNQTNTSNVSNKMSTTNVSIPKTSNKETISLLGNNKTSHICESRDSSIGEVSSTNNLAQEEETDFELNRSLLDAEVLALHHLIRTLAPDKDDNGTENHIPVDIKHIEDIYKTVLNIKSKLNAAYKQKSIKLRKSFESIQLFIPELKRGLTLPTLQQLKEKAR